MSLLLLSLLLFLPSFLSVIDFSPLLIGRRGRRERKRGLVELEV